MLSLDDAFTGLCVKCKETFEYAYAEKKKCLYCGRLLISEINSCLYCRSNNAVNTGQYNETISKLRALFPYTGKFRSVLSAFKFGKQLCIGNFFALFLDIAIRESGFICCEDSGVNALSYKEDTAWVPVPPRPGKLKKQGWDQIEFLAGQLERTFKQNKRNKGLQTENCLPVCRCLKRLPSKSQKVLNRDERETNLKGKIFCTKQPPKTAILFDDVITTGATLDACAEALLKGGAEKVYAVCLFYD